MTGSAVAAGALALLLFGGFAAYIFAGLETNTVQRIGHLTVFRDGYFLFGAGNPGRLRHRPLPGRDAADRGSDPVAGPMINVITPDPVAGRHRRQFQRRHRRFQDLPRHGLIPSDRDRMRQWDEFGAGAGVSRPTRACRDDDPTRG